MLQMRRAGRPVAWPEVELGSDRQAQREGGGCPSGTPWVALEAAETPRSMAATGRPLLEAPPARDANEIIEDY